MSARRPWPAEVRAEVERLYDEGRLTLAEITAQVGVPAGTVRKWIYDPDGAKDRARKESYGGTCVDCGARTTGCNGPGTAPERCGDCRVAYEAKDPLARARRYPGGPRRWTADAILESLRLAAAADGTLASNRFRAAHEETPERTPSFALVCQRFGTWHAAVEAAGLRRVSERSGGPARRFDHDTCVEAVRRVGDAMGVLPGASEYAAYRMLEDPTLPSEAIIRVRVGGWLRVLELASGEEAAA